ncbi:MULTISPECIES: phosphonate ABC transporter, permease protein PhnE [Aerococcus]|uniref:phosphonate ABC transporter, permease protein PhnE n=1 Tax=Aerococcus TaxID=1375 RepID=UPI000DCE466C|nr:MULTISPECIES: phosphonate ABC transporter, permease protein PhnE [Aerococcus]KAA9299053.1 phosphonate ABC transporter, permease protein PhnE [Aerococcus tenax]MDK6688218.1 phosphonate ABC transporter, permease protein PhnE [Aerococcus urinae]MDL5208201.1 phosphonate ABC transporter, permease protein PhnE [Aerococcus tenax]WIW73343.1 phosphonate ABC transporter, permease protein PhnE [Aerococcus tenax]WOZ52993.1 phosphonate ABC transporter, permease protein PhnE [Aerococcus tenax]
MNEKELSIYISQKKESRKKSLTVVFVILLIMLLGLWYLEISFEDLFQSLPKFITFFFNKFFPVHFGIIPEIIPDLLQTLAFAVVATCLATLVSLLLAFLMSRKIMDIRWLRISIRGFVSLLRNIPVVIWASVLVYIFGIGSMVAVIALFIALTGFLAKAFADSIDDIPNQTLEGLRACGASDLQIIRHGIVPQFIPQLMNWSLYSFERGIRASSILGLVGAGGIGILIQTRISLFKYQEAMAIVIAVIVMVILVEMLTNTIRRRIS